ncbi:MAG: hypothetical protein JO356_06295 [Acidobacteria bacterium]|nr:hypothetical protein [Acidobacteriota bacterium]
MFRSKRWILAIPRVLSLSVLSMISMAQTAQKSPMTNDGVIKMVEAGLPESVIITAIQSSAANFDISSDGLIKLKKAGVTANEMQAMIAAEQAANKDGTGGAAGKAVGGNTEPAPTAPGSRWRMPSVTLLDNKASLLPLEKTQLAQTKTKPRSLASLSGDSAVTQAIQAGVSDAAWDTAVHSHSAVGGSAVMQAGNVFGGMLGRRQATVTYVWAVPGPASANVLHTTNPTFAVNLTQAPGVNPEEFAPEIVKLTPAQNSCRLVGATQGKEDARSDNAADWEIYSAFVEDRVAASLNKTSSGEYKISPASPLLPGEYAVVLRPVSKNTKFSGGDVARGQGAGLMFNAAWTFQVSESAQ